MCCIHRRLGGRSLLQMTRPLEVPPRAKMAGMLRLPIGHSLLLSASTMLRRRSEVANERRNGTRPRIIITGPKGA